jgi:predicted acetyltransferase
MHLPNGLRLELVSLHHAESYVAMLEECLATDEGYPYNNYPLAQENFAAFVQELNDEAQGIGIPPGIPAQQTYVLLDAHNEVVGEFRFRPQLQPPYDQNNGHIGYNIRPSYRRQGYATQGIALLLDLARAALLTGVCVTIDEDNVISRRVIERNGGVVTHYKAPANQGKTIVCYWIKL